MLSAPSADETERLLTGQSSQSCDMAQPGLDPCTLIPLLFSSLGRRGKWAKTLSLYDLQVF